MVTAAGGEGGVGDGGGGYTPPTPPKIAVSLSATALLQTCICPQEKEITSSSPKGRRPNTKMETMTARKSVTDSVA